MANICSYSEKSQSVVTQVLCPSTSNFSLYGETNIMRCKIADPVAKELEACTPAKIVCSEFSCK